MAEESKPQYPRGDVRRLLRLALAMAELERPTLNTLAAETGHHKQTILDDMPRLREQFELTALSNGDGPGSKLDMLRQQVQQLKEHVVILSVSVRQTHLDHTILPRAPQNHAHLQGFSKRLVKSPWFGIRA
ncbi:hypothetical protein [Pseudomonas syringae]|uniref:hypothetical protein n=1 Tax=Pseudomonas syringae TaxID=317 RepID=UPI0002A7B1D9|nr:hypothetical protein [Pseudomonas syringae]ELQ01512.1 hypothetical protein A987_14025 [Pseudomonas syringae BRIP34881]ELQ01880.1 hypothetical protein A979_09242 [Pseudomonas syringae BRIP34876]